jgi:serine/threonine-protein kinase ULK/ATG1
MAQAPPPPPEGAALQPPAPPPPRIGEYAVAAFLGSGSFSTVYLGVHVATAARVAIKCIRTEGLTPAAARALAGEVSLQRAHSGAHPALLRLLDVHRSARHIFLVLEYAPGGDLHRWLRAHGPPGEAFAASVIAQVAAGLHALARRGVAHRDVKPANVLLMSTPDARASASSAGGGGGGGGGVAVKLADFGFARQVAPATLAATLCGSPLYMAPEVLRSGRGYDATLADVWSLGALLTETVTGRPPFSGANPMDLLANVEACAWTAGGVPPAAGGAADTCGGLLPPAAAARLSPACKHLLASMLRREPGQRITLEGVLAHPWVAAAAAAAEAAAGSCAEAAAIVPEPSPPAPAAGGPPRASAPQGTTAAAAAATAPEEEEEDGLPVCGFPPKQRTLGLFGFTAAAARAAAFAGAGAGAGTLPADGERAGARRPGGSGREGWVVVAPPAAVASTAPPAAAAAPPAEDSGGDGGSFILVDERALAEVPPFTQGAGGWEGGVACGHGGPLSWEAALAAQWGRLMAPRTALPGDSEVQPLARSMTVDELDAMLAEGGAGAV